MSEVRFAEPLPAGTIYMGACPRCRRLNIFKADRATLLHSVKLPNGMKLPGLHMKDASGGVIDIPVSVCDGCSSDPGEFKAAA